MIIFEHQIQAMEGNEKNRILVIDDNHGILDSIKYSLEVEYDVEIVDDPKRLPTFTANRSIDIFLLDMNFSAGETDGHEGLQTLREILKFDPDAVVIMITAYGEVNLAVRALKLGAFDFILKPFDIEKLHGTVSAAVKLRMAKKQIATFKDEQDYLKEAIDQGFSEIIASSPVMLDILQQVEKVARTDANVLISGENGTGKEMIARLIHRSSPRHDKVFVTVDLGSIQDTLIESELYGAVKGAYTDAKSDRTGKIELSKEGTLFLDEISNLSLTAQSKLLTAIEKKEITRLGSNHPKRIDFRLLSATNANITDMIVKGRFRQDLYYRINTVNIQLPPLRERGEDTLLMAKYFLDHFCRVYKKGSMSLSNHAKKALMLHRWPGNIRELKNLIENAVIFSSGSTIKPDDLRIIRPSDDIESLNLVELEKKAISRAIRQHAGNIKAAAETLGISRKTLYNKMKLYGL